jgi:hypothetical protein
MQPNACNEAPAFVIFGNFTGFQCPHFQQPGDRNMLDEPSSYQDYTNKQEVPPPEGIITNKKLSMVKSDP